MTKKITNRFKINEIIVDCQSMTLENNEKKIKLPVKVFEFLKLFLINENNIVDREEAIKLIWLGNEGVGKRGYVNAMWQIRKAFTDLGENSDELFTTLPKVGYFLAVKPICIEDKIGSYRKVKLYFGLFIVLLTIAASVSFYWYQNNYINERLPFPKSIQLQSQTNFQGIEEQPSVSHNGRKLAFSWLQENKKAKIYIKDLQNKNSTLKLISLSNYDELSPAWSADDQSLAYVKIIEDQCEVRVKHILTNKDRLIDKECSYSSFWNILDWSNDGLNLVYSKKINNKVAIFKYNFANNTSVQVSYPPTNSKDIMAIWLNNNRTLAVLRQTQQQFKIILLNEEGDESILVDNKNSITGIAWNNNQNALYATYLHEGNYFIYKIDVETKAKTQLKNIKGGSNLSFNATTNELFFSKHLLNEYIVQHSLIDQRIIRRVSSSSRDIYGEYIPETANIIFTSNRSSSWDLWLKSDKGTINLTKGIGAIATSAVSPNSKYFAVAVVKEGQNQQLFLGSLPEGELVHLQTPELTPVFPSWSKDGKRIYFSAMTNNKSGIYQYNLASKEIEQLTHSNEAHAVEGNNGDLYVTRKLENGIWKLTNETKTFTKVIDDLPSVDPASYFWENDTIYYLTRNQHNDLVKKYVKDDDDEIIATYPANSIRKYKGISKADYQSFIITLKNIYDADIHSISVE